MGENDGSIDGSTERLGVLLGSIVGKADASDGKLGGAGTGQVPLITKNWSEFVAVQQLAASKSYLT